MGLEAYVDAADLFVKIGSYGWYHSFRSTVCDKLEDGDWGSRFPLLQNHSDCDGDYSPEEAVELLEELRTIRKEFEGVMYPVVLYCDGQGSVLDYREKYSEAGIFIYGNGFGFGVTEEGLVVQSEDPTRVDLPVDGIRRDIFGRPEYRWYFALMEWKGGNSWECRRANGATVTIEGLPTGAPPGCVVIKKGEMPASEVFKELIDTMEELCRASEETGDPIVFC
ncbi:Immunity protein 70 [Thermanaeromonas toyohensis ToBE]|uniref:Immunity protein 70 n=1 Tax=Thermanaeromonas toyohensis ToBE TaxID=698762 RepID=A0A1W1VTZ9_9FIRM|nr:Imm70 family immunity protein [Thermanaeromonas toyohensis]SMB96753.1 Immunity protein 70 [Thermanaeromonas toyohensis ToBE]